MTTTESYKQMQIEDFRLTSEPYYLPIADEVELFETAYDQHVPVLLKGPTGCGKTRFVEYMSWRLHGHLGNHTEEGVPLITVACHEDLTASDLVGRYLLEAQGRSDVGRSRPAVPVAHGDAVRKPVRLKAVTQLVELRRLAPEVLGPELEPRDLAAHRSKPEYPIQVQPAQAAGVREIQCAGPNANPRPDRVLRLLPRHRSTHRANTVEQ